MYVCVTVKDAERKARLLQESKKSKEKAEKKRLKKQVWAFLFWFYHNQFLLMTLSLSCFLFFALQRQKERKRLEKKDINPIPDKEVSVLSQYLRRKKICVRKETALGLFYRKRI